jgi:hypothetical protein
MTLSEEYMRDEALKVPQPWDEGGRVHNWRNYIGARTRAIWDTFTDEQKIALAIDADDLAGQERWD